MSCPLWCAGLRGTLARDPYLMYRRYEDSRIPSREKTAAVCRQVIVRPPTPLFRIGLLTHQPLSNPSLLSFLSLLNPSHPCCAECP
jgi:hypothetical protein